MRRLPYGFFVIISCAMFAGFGCTGSDDAGSATILIGPRHDHQAPKIYDLQVVMNRPGVEVGWKTDEYSDSAIYLSVSAPSPTAPLPLAERYPDQLLQHWISLEGLAPATTYYFYVISRDYGENAAVSDVHTFTTPPPDAWP